MLSLKRSKMELYNNTIIIHKENKVDSLIILIKGEIIKEIIEEIIEEIIGEIIGEVIGEIIGENINSIKQVEILKGIVSIKNDIFNLIADCYVS